MEQFNTQEKALGLFTKNDCIGKENCIFITLQDNSSAKGGFVGDMEYPYNGILINKTENGIALQYLKNKKALSLSVKLDNLEIKEGECYFIKNSDNDILTVKNHSFLKKN